jgi:hypothetical protein
LKTKCGLSLKTYFVKVKEKKGNSCRNKFQELNSVENFKKAAAAAL